MSRHSNFIDGNDNFRDQNLRFVRNDLEENINQFFGGTGDNSSGAGPSGSRPPPRDFIIVQPKPGNNANEPSRSTELDQRRQYLIQLGLKRQQAHVLAVATMKVSDFSLRNIKQQRSRLSFEAGVSRQAEVDIQILRDINALVDAHKQRFQNRPCTPPPPSDINWNASPEMLSNFSKVSQQRETGLDNNSPAKRTADNIRGHRVEQSQLNDRTRQSQNFERNFERNDQNRRNFVRSETILDRNDNVRRRQTQKFKENKHFPNRELKLEREEKFLERQPENLKRNNNFLECKQNFERENNFRIHQSEHFDRSENLCDKRTTNFGRDENFQECQSQNFRNNDRFFEMDQHFLRDTNFTESQRHNFGSEDNFHESELNFERDHNFEEHQTGNFNKNLNVHNARHKFERNYNFRECLSESFEEANVPRGHSFQKINEFENIETDNNFREYQNFQGINNIREDYFNNSEVKSNRNTNGALGFNQRNTYCEDFKGDDFNNCRNNFNFNRNNHQMSPDRGNNQFGQQDQRNLNRNFQNNNRGGFWGRFNDDNERFNDEREQNNRENNFIRPGTPNFINRNDHVHSNDRLDEFDSQSDFDGNFQGQQVKGFDPLSDVNFPHQIQTVFYENHFKPEYDALLDVEGRLAMERRNFENDFSERTYTKPDNFQSRRQLNHNPRDNNQNLIQFRGPFQNRSVRNDSLGGHIQRNNEQNNFSENINRAGSSQITKARFTGQRSNSVVHKPPNVAATSRTVSKPGQLNSQGPTNRAENNDQSTSSSKPTGLCVKSFKVNSNEKFFINVCQAAEVPNPKDITDQELIHILESVEPGSFRVPMSISELRNSKDRSNNAVEVCDIAINPKFLVKIQKSQLFNNFFLQIVAEALHEKYNIQISMDKTIILSNRQVVGTLVAHRVRNDDVQRVEKSSNEIEINLKKPSQDQVAKQAKLVQEIDAELASNIHKNWAKNHEPAYKLRARTRDEVVDEIHVELYLPNCVSSQEFSLDIGEDRILIESLKHGYIFDKFVNYRLNQDRAQALFDKTSKMLQVRIPVYSV